MFQWFNDLILFISKFFPHIQVMDSTQAGVAFGGWRRIFGIKRLRIIQPNRIYIWWPWCTEILVRDVVRQTLQLPSQTVLVRGENNKWINLTIRGIVVYSIRDIEKAIVKVEDVDEAIGDLAAAAIKMVIMFQPLKRIIKGGSEINDELRKELRRKLYDYGVRVHNVFLSDVCVCQVYRIAGGAIVAAGDR